ncbi:thaumatin [Schizophyllum amplum]|uniref:Thaumatin n=1 Tax=Schizophyllum amplum TaxID=97359 RepID=A0A550CLY0_9AGAR|nr:thaumatin [Auriculariopsis ampla]
MSLLASVSAFTINFNNKCGYAIWPAVGAAPNGQPDASIAWGQKLEAGASASTTVDDHALGVRAWGRTGCDASGSNCATGACVGGMVCTDAGITAAALYSEYGYGDQGQWGGELCSWDLSYVGGSINIPASLSSSDGKSVTCTEASCPTDQAYANPDDHEAVRQSSLGATYTHTFCP